MAEYLRGSLLLYHVGILLSFSLGLLKNERLAVFFFSFISKCVCVCV